MQIASDAIDASSSPYDFKRLRRVIHIARPRNRSPPCAALALQPPPPLSAPGQHTPFPPDARQPKPLGQFPLFAWLQGSTHTFCVPSLAHWFEMQSVFMVHDEPSPPSPPTSTQRPSTQP